MSSREGADAREDRAAERERPPAASVVGAAAAPVAGVGSAILLLAVTRGSGDVQAFEDIGWRAYVIVGIAIVSIASCATLLSLAVRGRQVPAAALLALGALPWMAGDWAMRFVVGMALPVVKLADPASVSLILARGTAEAAAGRLLGACLSAGLLAGIGVGLAIAAPARRTGGAFSTAVALSLAATFAWSAGVAAFESQSAVRAPLLAFSSVASENRAQAIATGVEAVRAAQLLGAYGAVAGLALTIVVAAWYGARRRPSLAASLGAIAALALLVGTEALDARVMSATVADVTRSAVPPWSSIAGLELIELDPAFSGWPYELDAVVARDAVHLRSGARVRLSELESPTGTRTVLEELRRAAAGRTPPECCTEPPRRDDEPYHSVRSCLMSRRRISLVLDARVGGRTLRALSTIANEAGADALVWVGREPATERPTIASDAPLLSAVTSQPVLARRQIFLPRAAARCLAADSVQWRAVIGDGPVARFVARDGAGQAPFEIDVRPPPTGVPLGDWQATVTRDELRLALRTVVYVYASDGASAEAVSLTAERVQRRARDVVLMTEASPGAELTAPVAPAGD